MTQEANCAPLAPTDEIDSTRYRRFLWCVSERDPLREAILSPAAQKPASLPVAKALVFGRAHGGKSQAKVTKARAAYFAKKRKEWLRDLWRHHGVGAHECAWALGIEYQQTWKRLARHRGRLLGSAPLGLFPARLEVVRRSWEKRLAKRTLNEALEEARTLEVGATDRWSLAAKKQFVAQSNSTFNPSATLNSVTIPAGSAPVTLGGSLGIAGALASGATNTLEKGSEFIAENTLKAIESIKAVRTTTIEESVEAGEERTGTETLSNPNRCNTLTYCYYEVVERCEVASRPVGVDLFLFVPLPYQQTLSLDWLLANECALRPLIPCAHLQAGFDAARKLRAAELARQRRLEDIADVASAASGSAGTGRDTALEGVVAAVNGLLEAYEGLSGARSTQRGVGSWLYWELVQLLATGLADALAFLDERWAAISTAKRAEVSEAVEEFRGRIGDVNAEFLKVNAAVAVCEAAAAGFGLTIVPPLSFGVVAAIGAILAGLEAAGLDALPDDRGLQAKIKRVFVKMDAVLVPAIAASPFAAQSDYALSQEVAERLRAERALQEWAESQVAVDALRTHIGERIFFYHQVLWSQFDANRIKQRLVEIGLPPALFELRFYGFDLDRAALRVTDFELAKKLGFDPRSLDDWTKACLDERLARKHEVILPTPAVVVEPLLGECAGADGFVLDHRALDLARAEAELHHAEAVADQAAEEAERMRERIQAGVLDDPTPFGRADRLAVHVADDGNGAALPAAGGQP